MPADTSGDVGMIAKMMGTLMPVLTRSMTKVPPSSIRPIFADMANFFDKMDMKLDELEKQEKEIGNNS